MFTGIIEEVGVVKSRRKDKTNLIINVKASFLKELTINQSISHNGACLTIIDVQKDAYSVCVVGETINKTNLGLVKLGEGVNLERCLKVGQRLDGHFVQGHIDAIIKCVKIVDKNGSWTFTFQYPKNSENYLIPKGSITLNGVSLTISHIDDSNERFEVTIIPYTFQHTNFKNLQIGDYVNVEFDIISKQIVKLNQKK